MKIELKKKDGSILVIETIAITLSVVGFCYYDKDAGHSIFISKDDYKSCSIVEE